MNVIIEEVLYPSNPISVEEEVLVPVIYQKVPRYKLDPLWDSLEETPKNHIQMIVYKGRDEDYDVSFWFYDQDIRVNWGDGIIEDILNNGIPGYNRVNHKFVDGSGKLDSNGERFWFVDITIIKNDIAYNSIILSNYKNSQDYSKSIIKAVSINREGLYTNLVCSDSSLQYPPYVEYIRVHGKHIIGKNDTLNSRFIKEIKFDSNNIKFEKLIGDTFPNNYPDYPINIFNPELVGSYANAIFSKYAPILLKKSYDLRKFTFSSISSLFEGNDIVEEIYLPEQSSENWKNIGYMLSGCIRLRRLIFPKDQSLFSYVDDLTSSFSKLYNLEEVENFPNEHIGEFSDKAIICTGFDYFKYSMGFGNNEIKLRCFIANDSYINSLYFSNESPFDYGSTHINLLRAKFEKDSLLSLFNRLPDFKNSNSRTINIVDNPGTSELMEEDIKIAADKNWVVITK